jgi:two-component system nitrogen regulation response regulator NtrX
MSLKTQAKVLRVLQEGEVERVGSARTIKVDVRVIAATNKVLEREIEKGTFREDLFFRLSVIPVFVPPLRERGEDIPVLVRHFLGVFTRENNFRPKRITPAAMDALQRHRWKGNIRELRNAVERTIIMTPGDTIDADDLPENLRAEPKALAPVAAAAMPGTPSDVESGFSRAQSPAGGEAAPLPGTVAPGTLREFKETSERNFLVQKLRENGWNISRTAEVIGTPRSNLYKKLEFYKIAQETDG